MEKIIKLTELRKLNSKVANGDISALQMVEIINKSAFRAYVLKMEKLNNELKHLQILVENKNALIETLESDIKEVCKSINISSRCLLDKKITSIIYKYAEY
jgi:uncharacterized protein (UPF0335 family)